MQDSSVDCVHYWIIESANGPTSWGRCKRCGNYDKFQNSYDGNLFNNSNHKGAPKPTLVSTAERVWKEKNIGR